MLAAAAALLIAAPIGCTRENPHAQADWIAASGLPTDARQTVALIRQGGPFPYQKDGTTFFNREGKLPSAPRGYYREYTVAAPGSSDRGAKRIITGERGELYYTPDYYRSFKRVRE